MFYQILTTYCQSDSQSKVRYSQTVDSVRGKTRRAFRKVENRVLGNLTLQEYVYQMIVFILCKILTIKQDQLKILIIVQWHHC